MKTKISILSRVFLVLSMLMLIVSNFVPIWQIELDAPQYPEGLALQIWSNKLAGDVDIINGLNHYIGMKTLHAEDFIEFTILPYLIGAFALLFLLASIRATRRWLLIAFIAFVVFGIVAMVDFWIWEYNYGHNLDPNAAIKVPGMAYQPPLIGFKQLLNFGAYSIPHIGGWLFVAVGLLLLFSVLKEFGFSKKFSGKRKSVVVIFMFFSISMLWSCNNNAPEPIKLNVDACSFCRMKISDGRFAAQLITSKGRNYKFDDLKCMLNFSSQFEGEIKSYYIAEFSGANELTDAGTAWYIQNDDFKSPMGGNTAAFKSKTQAESEAQATGTKVLSWSEVSSSIQQNHPNEHP